MPGLIIEEFGVPFLFLGTDIVAYIFTSVFFFRIFHSIQLTNAVIKDVALVLSAITNRDNEVQPSSPRNAFDASSRARFVTIF